ncbi:unnamed protein product [Aspergillus oryzae RIB40]|nr:unnamed protein product [Aspergillus oryzae RIB40]BAE56589.1 unnamed protein product [Aspergillus oryzae RIB40]
MQRPLDSSRVVELAEMRQLLEGVAKIEPDRDCERESLCTVTIPTPRWKHSAGWCLRLGTIYDDDSLWTDPTSFDGYRFEKLRTIKGNELKFQYASTSTSELNWGYGTHACPGRHYASNQIKLMIVSLLSRYEFQFDHEQTDKKAIVERPPNVVDGVRIMPNPQTLVMVRSLGNVNEGCE